MSTRLVAMLVFLLVAQSDAIKLKEVTVLDGAVTLQVPDSFSPMKEEILRLKYPSERRPTVVYTNERASVNVAANLTQTPARPEQLRDLHKGVEASFKNLYPSATWYRSEVIVQGGREYLILDLTTPAIDTQVRNIMLGTAFRGRLLLVTFNVTRELEKTWIETGQKIIESVRVKD